MRDDETPKQAALRVAAYEAGVCGGAALYGLTCMGYVPAAVFGAHAAQWGDDVVVVPVRFFAMCAGTIKVSEQHDRIQWLSFEDAAGLFTEQDYGN